MKEENRLFGNSKEIFPNEREKERGDEVSLTFDCEKKNFSRFIYFHTENTKIDPDKIQIQTKTSKSFLL